MCECKPQSQLGRKRAGCGPAHSIHLRSGSWLKAIRCDRYSRQRQCSLLSAAALGLAAGAAAALVSFFSTFDSLPSFLTTTAEAAAAAAGASEPPRAVVSMTRTTNAGYLQASTETKPGEESKSAMRAASNTTRQRQGVSRKCMGAAAIVTRARRDSQERYTSKIQQHSKRTARRPWWRAPAACTSC